MQAAGCKQQGASSRVQAAGCKQQGVEHGRCAGLRADVLNKPTQLGSSLEILGRAAGEQSMAQPAAVCGAKLRVEGAVGCTTKCSPWCFLGYQTPHTLGSKSVYFYSGAVIVALCFTVKSLRGIHNVPLGEARPSSSSISLCQALFHFCASGPPVCLLVYPTMAVARAVPLPRLHSLHAKQLLHLLHVLAALSKGAPTSSICPSYNGSSCGWGSEQGKVGRGAGVS